MVLGVQPVRAELQDSSEKAMKTNAKTGTVGTVSSDSKASLDDPLDYSMLYNRIFDYNDIVAAKTTNRLDDNGVAGVLKIAKTSGLSFRYIVNRVGIGQNLPVVAAQLGYSPDLLKNVSKEKDEIAAYEAAYLATGELAQRRNTIEHLLSVAAKNKPKK